MDNQNPSENEHERKRSSIDRLNDLYRKYNNIRSAARLARTSVRWIIKQAPAQVIQGGGRLLLSYVGIPVAIIFAIVLFAVIAYLGLEELNKTPDEEHIEQPRTEQSIPGFTLTLSGPPDANLNDTISYTITYTHDPNFPGSVPLDSITIYYKVPTHLDGRSIYEYQISTTGSATYSNITNTVAWNLGNPSNKDGIIFTVKAITDDVLVRNNVYAVSSYTPPNPGGGTISPPPVTTDFSVLMKGQGRNVGVLGDENSFTQQVMTNSSGRIPAIANKESYIRTIYRLATAKNVNPLITLSIWGVENSFRIGTAEFGCLPPSSYPGFDSQVNCNVVSIDRLMREFEEGRLMPTGGCTFDDPFLYAMERYTPVCTNQDHGNDPERKNFVTFYTIFLGR